LMGAATAWQLARRGYSVALVEAFAPGHRGGSSHGSSRIYRLAYTDPFYVRLADRAGESWRELEADCGETLLQTTGGLDTGTSRDPALLAAAMAAAGVPHELLSASAAQERWPQFRFDGRLGEAGRGEPSGLSETVLYHPTAGTIDADATIRACVRRAAELGARVLTGVRVASAEQLSGNRIRVLGDGLDLVADTLVVAAGGWLPELAGRIGVPLGLPPLTVTQQEVFHFRQRDPDVQWPTFVDKAEIQIFGLPSGTDGGPEPTVKVARYDGGVVTSASARDGVVNPEHRTTVADYVRRRLPGLDPEPVAEASCLFTSTPTEDFVLDRRGPVVVVSPCSGHGAKFAPLIGGLAADLAVGRAEPLPRFALGRLDSMRR
jgi:monomeric sarcosine oxidase